MFFLSVKKRILLLLNRTVGIPDWISHYCCYFKTYCLTIEPDMSLFDIKRALIELYQYSTNQPTFIDPRQLCLTSQGKVEENLVWNKNNVTVFVHLRQPGGCFMISFTILMTIILACMSSVCTCGLSLFVIPVLLPLLFILPLFCL